MTKVRLPRLLDARLNEITRLHPVSLSINERLTPPSDAAMTLPMGENAPFHAWVELYTIDGSAGFYRVNNASDSYSNGSDADLEHSAAILGDTVIMGEGTYEGTYAEIFAAMLENQTTLINGQKPWILGDCAMQGQTTFAYDQNNILSAMLELVGDIKDGYALEFDDRHGFPWRVNVVAVETSASCEGRLSRNLTSVSVSTSDDGFCTRVFCEELPEPHYMDGENVNVWGVVTKTISASDKVEEAELRAYIARYLHDHKDPQVSISVTGVDLSQATGESVDSFKVGRVFRLALPDYSAKLEERILVRTISEVYNDPTGVRLTLANNIKDTAALLVETDNTTTGGTSQNSTRKYASSTVKGTGISQTSLLDMLSMHDEFVSDTEAWYREAGVKIEANHADLYATKTAITGVLGDAEKINALIRASSDAGGLVAMMVGRHSILEDTTALIQATAAGGGLVTLKANQTELEKTNSEVEAAKGRISNAEINLDGANAKIELKADVTVTDELGKRVSAAEITIDGLNSEISLKADKITLSGYVTASQLEAELANFKLTMNDNVVTHNLNVTNNTIINNLTMKSNVISLDSMNVATGVNKGTIVYVSQIITNSDGTVKSIKGSSHTFVESLNYTTINYLSY